MSDSASAVAPTPSRREQIIEVAAALFAERGFHGASVYDLGAAMGTSGAALYKHFASKEALFIEIVTNLTNDASDIVHGVAPELAQGDDLHAYLAEYGYRQLTIVLTPRLMQLRRVVIGEAGRFPDLGKALYESGPKRAMAAMAAMIQRLADRELLRIEDAATAASHFNWLVMSQPLNQAMLLGDAGIPGPEALRQHAAAAARMFLAAYGAR